MHFFLHVCMHLSAGRGYFLARPAAGNAGTPVRTPRHTFGPQTGSVARALGVLSRASWFCSTRVAFRLAETRKTIETP